MKGNRYDIEQVRNKKERASMQSQRSFARLSAIISLLGSVLVIYGVFFLPMALGNGGGSFTPTSEWMVAYFFFHYIFGPTIVLVALPMLSVLFVLGTSVASFFRELSPGLVIWRRRVALAGLIIQSVLGLFMVFIYT